ncbi:MAG: DUF5989 family protein [Planctomycetaceae bacterium]
MSKPTGDAASHTNVPANSPGATPSEQQRRFEQQATEKELGLLAEFWDFLRFNRKWWMAPIVLVLLLVAALLVLSALGLSPFIYTTI